MTVKFEGNPSIPTFNITAEGIDGRQYDKDGIDGSMLSTLKIVYDAACGHFNNGIKSWIAELKVVGGKSIFHGEDCPKCKFYQACRRRP